MEQFHLAANAANFAHMNQQMQQFKQHQMPQQMMPQFGAGEPMNHNVLGANGMQSIAQPQQPMQPQQSMQQQSSYSASWPPTDGMCKRYYDVNY